MRFLISCLLLVAIAGCSKKKVPATDTCKNRDSRTNACLDEAGRVVDPNAANTDWQRKFDAAMADEAVAEKFAADVQSRLDQKKNRNPNGYQEQGNQGLTLNAGVEMLRQITEKWDIDIPHFVPGEYTSEEIRVDVNQPPSVILDLTHRGESENGNKAIQPVFIFSHTSSVSSTIVIAYGNPPKSSLFYNYGSFYKDEIKLNEPQIPVKVAFSFKDENYCALGVIGSTERTQMQVNEGVCQ